MVTGSERRGDGRRRAIALVEKVPTRWFVTAGAAVLLLATAAFGGLAEAPHRVVPDASVGERIDGDPLAVTVERVVAIDALPESGIVPADGKRLLGVVAVIENTWDRPVSSGEGTGARDSIRLVGVDEVQGEPADTVALFADGTTDPDFPVDVPVEVVFFWEVDPMSISRIGDGGSLRIDVFGRTGLQQSGAVTDGVRWTGTRELARLAVALDDRGDGADGGDE